MPPGTLHLPAFGAARTRSVCRAAATLMILIAARIERHYTVSSLFPK
jgi:hypothetical protein